MGYMGDSEHICSESQYMVTGLLGMTLLRLKVVALFTEEEQEPTIRTAHLEPRVQSFLPEVESVHPRIRKLFAT